MPDGDLLISVTRLRLMAWRYLPAFLWHSARAIGQARRTPGFRGLRLLADRRLAFWTATAWDDLVALKRYRGTGGHRAAMPLMAGWCDEGSVLRWTGPLDTMADWDVIHARMLAEGTLSPVTRPSADQIARRWAPPRRHRLRELLLPARPRGRRNAR